MITHITSQWGSKVAALSTMAAVLMGALFYNTASAAPPVKVTYSGTPVTTAVPGKPFTVKFQVKNTGTSTYSGVKVIFHIPEGLKHSKLTSGSSVIDDVVSWNDLHLEGGQSFYPSFTFTVDSGTPLKTKLPIWVEVTGEDMEATSTNFSVTTVSAVKTSSLSSTDISSMFQAVYGRTPTSSELTYWLGRRSDKPGRVALEGAMGYHKSRNIQH